MEQPAWEFTHRRRVEFTEVDMGGVVHFSNYFRMMECAEHAFFRSLALPILEPWEGRTLAWPRVRVSCQYKAPLHFGDLVAIRVVVTQKRPRSLELGFMLHREKEDGALEPVAQGLVRLACVEIDPSKGAMRTTNLPAVVEARLVAAPPEVAQQFASAGHR